MSYGQSSPSQTAKPVDLAANQVVTNVDFRLPRGGVIAGRIVDEFGDPVSNVQVMTLRTQFTQGQSRITQTGRQATTNDIGEFRLYGLAPGKYYVSATYRSQFLGNQIDVSENLTGYAATYYPGTPDATSAQAITIGAGETINGINLQLIPVRTASISGTAYDAEGRPLANGVVMVMPNRTGGIVNAGPGGRIKADGSFLITNVTPGEYTLQSPIGPGNGRGGGRGGNGRGGPGATPVFARAVVNVNGSDVTGVVLAPVPPATARGRVIIDASGSANVQTNNLRITASAVQAQPLAGGQSAPAQVNDDLTFELQVSPGRATLRPTVAGDWVLKAVRSNGEDVTDAGIEFKPGEAVEGIEVEITNHPPEVSGSVTNAKSEPIKDYTVLLFPQSRDLWTTNTREFAVVRPDKDGRYKTRSLPPDRYYAIAVESVDLSEWRDPEFLGRIASDATKFSLSEGENKSLDLKLATQ
jgi:hypothetical protein